MRMETWNLKIGDLIDLHYTCDSYKAKVIRMPLEVGDYLYVDWRIDENIHGTAIFNDNKNRWDVATSLNDKLGKRAKHSK